MKYKATVKMIQNEHKELSDIFLKDFDETRFENYFNKNAWKSVKCVINKKNKYCTCSVCAQLCIENSIECDGCHF
jgi:coenzyme F420-reducing hydrogenase gamma subunit